MSANNNTCQLIELDEMNLGPAVFTFNLRVNHSNMHQQRVVLHAFTYDSRRTLSACVPLVLKVAAHTHIQHLAGQHYRPAEFVFGNPGVFHSYAGAKYAAAFLGFHAPF